MQSFEEYLRQTGEVGYIDEVVHSIVYVSGLPTAKLNEIVMFEGDGVGEVMSLTPEYAEVLILTPHPLKVGSRVARTGRQLEVGISDEILGKVVQPLNTGIATPKEFRKVHVNPSNILNRRVIDEPLYTGVSLIDLVVPLGQGQRELVIGDKKTGKTEFILQTMVTQAKLGNICIYAGIGKKQVEIKKVYEFLKEEGIEKQSVVVSATAGDPAGLIFIAPYTAMTIAEYFRDQGKNVLLILDDLTTHARSYREISLLARRFPGRNSYPGDIFYIHSRLIERGGKFNKGIISCLPVAESVMGDLSGYVQTNLMAMTDGHIFFDVELSNLGRRPAVNPFLSVTRVGYQAQSPLVRDLSRELNSFLVSIENLRSLLHFGAELSEQVKQSLDLGDRTFAFFDQPRGLSMPINASLITLAALWAGFWKQVDYTKMKLEMKTLVENYNKQAEFKTEVDKRVQDATKLAILIDSIKQNDAFLLKWVRAAGGSTNGQKVA